MLPRQHLNCCYAKRPWKRDGEFATTADCLRCIPVSGALYNRRRMTEFSSFYIASSSMTIALRNRIGPVGFKVVVWGSTDDGACAQGMASLRRRIDIGRTLFAFSCRIRTSGRLTLPESSYTILKQLKQLCMCRQLDGLQIGGMIVVW